MSKQEPQRGKFDALLQHALQTAPMPAIPASFAEALQQQVSDHEEQAGWEIWLTRIPVAIAVLMLSAFFLPWLNVISEQLTERISSAPWPILLMTAAILALIKLLDVKQQTPLAQRL